ncbi:MAG: response regulator transcription factor [Candidatus Pseudobacter hemicellulosilyticus]|uniref:Response regulator transcription factor n=1 Tax=Candidatus Pseudobacter hemicellulosilyticus TaxID=3121375 RepID=A0AAJ5WLR5_9BACT|nr:MAG: response regulator transcription factor [Pseudobacter sp.]
MRILIIEDEIIIARFIEEQLTANFNCTTQVALDHLEVAEAMPQLMPHLLLCDINLKEKQDGITLVNELQNTYAFEVIFITSYQSKNMIERASALKPLNYIIKPVDEPSIYAAIKLAEPLIMGNSKLGRLSGEDLQRYKFTETERTILQLILHKKTTKEIADILHVSPYTIKNHRHNICRKLDLKDENNALLKWTLLNENLLS